MARFGLAAAFIAVFALCVCAGSVAVAPADTLRAVARALRGLAAGAGAATGAGAAAGAAHSIIVNVRLPRVLCAAFVGAALSLCGGAMQGLLRNPLADGSTLGVSAGAALGAAVSIAFGASVPGMPAIGAAGMAMAFGFLSLVLVLALAHGIDRSLATNTIILVGVVFSMFAGSLISLVVAFAGERARSVTFWMMGSLAGASYADAAALVGALLLFGAPLLRLSRELDAFAVGEGNARCIGVDVKGTRLRVLVCVAGLIGVCVSIGGTIGFVGLIVPHMSRMAVGPAHSRLLPSALCAGAAFLMLADLVGRVALSPVELPIGIVTSLVGTFVFIAVFARARGTA